MSKSFQDFHRFWSKVRIEGFNPAGCWIWIAHRNRDGYGRFYFDGRVLEAYRVAYEMMRGSVPTGKQIDHLCRNRACVNPDHLEAVTGQVNILRGNTLPAANVAKTHCPKEHVYNYINTHWYKNQRLCRACNRQATQTLKRRKRDQKTENLRRVGSSLEKSDTVSTNR